MSDRQERMVHFGLTAIMFAIFTYGIDDGSRPALAIFTVLFWVLSFHYHHKRPQR